MAVPEEEIKIKEDETMNKDNAIAQDKHTGRQLSTFKLKTIIGIIGVVMTSLLVILLICVVVLFKEVNQLKTTNEDFKHLMSVISNNSESEKLLIRELKEGFDNQSREISMLRSEFVASPQEFLEEKLNALRDELTNQILSYHHIISDNVTAVTNRLARLETVLVTTEQKVSSVNETIAKTSEVIEELSTIRVKC